LVSHSDNTNLGHGQKTITSRPQAQPRARGTFHCTKINHHDDLACVFSKPQDSVDVGSTAMVIGWDPKKGYGVQSPMVTFGG
jgi:hypothetical protein